MVSYTFTAVAGSASITGIETHRHLGEKRYEIKDHLGNVRAVVSDIKNAENYSLSASSWKFLADVRSLSNYYPYGMKIDKGSWSSSNYQFAYNGKQEEVFDKDYLHYGARTYNSELGSFISTDPQEVKYNFVSPYIYALNNPINAFDPDGEAVLFVNGQHFDSGGQVKYWGGFDRIMNKQLSDYNSHYIDGAMGGWNNTLYNGLINSNNLYINDRYESGKLWAKMYGKAFIKSLGASETIKVVTHSMGVGTSRGIIDGLNEIAKDLKVTLKYEFLLDVESYQGADIKIPMLDGNVIFEEGQHFSKVSQKNFFSIIPPFVDHTPNSIDATSQNEFENNGHNIKDYDAKNLPKLDSKTSGEYNIIEYGNKNEKKRNRINKNKNDKK